MIRRSKILKQEETLILLEAMDYECSHKSNEEDIDDVPYKPPIYEGESSTDDKDEKYFSP